MRGDYPIPPPRDLPPHRVAQRREHLLSEIAQPPWRLRLPRRGLVALVAAALIVVVGTAAAIGGVGLILDRGFIGLAPVGATPSAPESGELVVDWTGGSATLHQAAPRAANRCPRLGVRRRANHLGPASLPRAEDGRADCRGCERVHLRLPRATTHAGGRRAQCGRRPPNSWIAIARSSRPSRPTSIRGGGCPGRPPRSLRSERLRLRFGGGGRTRPRPARPPPVAKHQQQERSS